MTMSDRADDRLDLLLGAWAAQQRLDQRQADDILHAITGQPRDSLTATWWTELSTRITAAVVLAACAPSTLLGGPGVDTLDAAA